MLDLYDRLEVKYDEKPCYDIVLKESFQDLIEEINAFELKNRKICIVTDSNVGLYYLKQLEELLLGVPGKVVSFVFPAGEDNKNLETVQNLYEYLIRESFDRNDVLLALGGGVVGDLTGYTAATYLRGIRFLQVPTSLLAMVDSSIGGKTGVDFKAYKNMVGAFHMPSCVYMNLECLKTLEERIFLSGMGEIIKHGLIQDKAYYEWLKDNKDAIVAKDIAVLRKMVGRSCEIKRAVVEIDPHEHNERAWLNFGHTIGHAVEKWMEFTLLHGECVAIGMSAAIFLSYERGYLTKEEHEDILSTIEAFKLPIRVQKLEIANILEALSRDKKMDAGQIKFILLRSIGEAFIDTTITKKELIRAIEFIMEER
ncbi:3-dehydroquinate synthase [Lachnoclostridium phytofermentans]|uniref:3-dehydroquinate synthase n=1 Tax=Lachnoclostridium phytofermentans (strain ATCC 700394 / DSM 18823 / ISDg) TaxID=357809 RepID=A9KKY7_LACP7|nr:3-dehydroquinate synthase [Lachnoclostridium phytofermentans]ABX42719.1 3-dehydroquinate synthase [Lachnoclostridium phytofermentans ISDg]